MKNLRTKYPKLYAEWVNTDMMATVEGAPVPAAPVVPQTPKAALAEAKQEWDDEGGSIEASIKPVGVKPGPKIPL